MRILQENTENGDPEKGTEGIHGFPAHPVAGSFAVSYIGQVEFKFQHTGSHISNIFANINYWGFVPSSTQNWRLYGASGGIAIETTPGNLHVDFGGNINVTGSVNCNGSLNCGSDETLKDKIELADIGELYDIFERVHPKKYERKDLQNERRIGFVSQDFERALPNDFPQNIVSPNDSGTLLFLDYSRLSTILWGCCKFQQQQITQLSARVSALESKRRKT